MIKSDEDFGNDNLQKLEQRLNDLAEALTLQNKYLERHSTAMEKLTQAVKQLEITIKKEVNVESRQSTIQLDDLIKLFVEYDINPRYYHVSEHKMLKGTETRRVELARRKQNPRIRSEKK